MRIPLGLLTLAFLTAPLTLAGSVNLAWDPSAGATSYKVYSGSSSGTLGSPVNVGNTTQTTFGTMQDCTATYFGVKASNSAGDSGYSNIISSWPRPSLSGANPLDGSRGATVSVVISGNNFQPGATLQTSNAGITVNSVTRNACGQLTASLTIGGSAATGPVTLTVVNGNGVAGSASSLFSVVGTPLPNVNNLHRTDKQ